LNVKTSKISSSSKTRIGEDGGIPLVKIGNLGDAGKIQYFDVEDVSLCE
jgi:hypothetical protein